MSNHYVVIDGRRIAWKDILKARKEQRAATKASQLILFPLVEDFRPPSQKTATGRYNEPTLLDYLKK